MENDIELFYNSNQYVGFAGMTKVRDSDVFIDTRNGTGYDTVIEKLSDMISYLAGKFDIDGFTQEDNKQHIIVLILEGISKFNPSKDTKLSTFLQMRVSRRLINEVRDANRFKYNATLLNTRSFSYKCNCGNSITSTKEENLVLCSSCGAKINLNKRMWIKKPTISLDGVSDGYASCNNTSNTQERKIQSMDLMAVINNEDEEIKNILCMMYYDGLTIKEVAQKLNVSSSNVYVKLKGLRKNTELKNVMRGYDE